MILPTKKGTIGDNKRYGIEGRITLCRVTRAPVVDWRPYRQRCRVADKIMSMTITLPTVHTRKGIIGD
jgi:hypothetical protein